MGTRWWDSGTVRTGFPTRVPICDRFSDGLATATVFAGRQKRNGVARRRSVSVTCYLSGALRYGGAFVVGGETASSMIGCSTLRLS
jgi:hypothetical protein